MKQQEAESKFACLSRSHIKRCPKFKHPCTRTQRTQLPAQDSEVSFNPAAFTRELEQVLGMSMGGQQGEGWKGSTDDDALGGDGDEEDEWEGSTEEGSSFFSDDDEAEESGTDDDDGRGSDNDQGEGSSSGDEGEGLSGRGGDEKPSSSGRMHSTGSAQVDLGRGSSSSAAQAVSNGQGGVALGRGRGRGAAGTAQQQPPLPPRLQKLQDAWEVRTATDSDDERGRDSDKDALSIGGHSEEGSGSESDGE